MYLVCRFPLCYCGYVYWYSSVSSSPSTISPRSSSTSTSGALDIKLYKHLMYLVCRLPYDTVGTSLFLVHFVVVLLNISTIFIYFHVEHVSKMYDAIARDLAVNGSALTPLSVSTITTCSKSAIPSTIASHLVAKMSKEPREDTQRRVAKDCARAAIPETKQRLYSAYFITTRPSRCNSTMAE